MCYSLIAEGFFIGSGKKQTDDGLLKCSLQLITFFFLPTFNQFLLPITSTDLMACFKRGRVSQKHQRNEDKCLNI